MRSATAPLRSAEDKIFPKTAQENGPLSVLLNPYSCEDTSEMLPRQAASCNGRVDIVWSLLDPGYRKQRTTIQSCNHSADVSAQGCTHIPPKTALNAECTQGKATPVRCLDRESRFDEEYAEVKDNDEPERDNHTTIGEHGAALAAAPY
ncbi:hypothetical protein FIBSPDRAFT_957365 [Athelia psychrophila]|uniref:Uncharacterized protein n=1 Tax=Athelia psychrophila TaxID=1759441 RepID=A0A166FUU3_9AGAM|nr:hypothetical protein FIBSPDRAFT_957365 [Fibularhizoctonia sp. CBS 109695]